MRTHLGGATCKNSTDLSYHRAEWGWGLARRRGNEKVRCLFFVIGLFVTSLNDKVYAHDFAINALGYGNNFD